MPVAPNKRVNAVLTNFAQLAQQKATGFGYYKMFSILPVEHRADSYIQYSVSQIMRDEAEEIAPGDESVTGHLDGEEMSYLCKKRGIKKAITEEDYDNAQNKLTPQKLAQIYTQQKVMIRLERIFAANFLATSKWSSDQTGVASNPSTNQFVQWNASSGSTIMANVEAWKEIATKNSGGNPPNKIGFTADVYAALRAHSEIKDYIKYTTIESASLQTLAKLFDVDEAVIIGGGVYNSANEKGTTVMSRAATGKVLLTYAPQVASAEDLTAGVCFAWNRKGKGFNKYGLRVRNWWDEARECDFVEAQAYNDLKLVYAGCGLLANTVLG